MNCKWCNKLLNGANDYQQLGFCNIQCRMLGGDSDKIDLEAELFASPRVVVEVPSPPVVVQPKRPRKPKPNDVIPSLDEFFKSTFKGQIK